MTIRFDCQFCGKTLNADDAKAGKKVNCPSCEAMLTIPELEVDEVLEDAIERSPSEPSRAPTVSGGRKIPCPACDELISPKESVCPWCGEETTGTRKRRTTFPIAGPMQRLYGAAIDFIAAMVFIGPGLVLGIIGIVTFEDHRGEPPVLTLLGTLGFFVGGLVCLVIQVYLLMQRSQSIGKYFANLQIMDNETDTPAGLVKSFLLRGVVNYLIGSVACPPLYSIVDVLFVFSDEHRCLHDQIAGTYVADISDA